MEQEKRIYDCVIIGSGPAGMSAAIYARRFDLDTLVLEYNAPGGAIINTENISNYPGFKNINGVDLAMEIYNQMMELKVNYQAGEVKNIKKLGEKEFVIETTNEKTYFSHSVIIATGTKNKTLGLESEKKFFYKGISWCAICDGPLYKKKDVCVVGGGNSALQSALSLANFVNKVYLIHRRDEFRGDLVLVNKIKALDNIELVLNSDVVSFNGSDTLESITVKNKENKKEKEIKVSACFESVGRIPNTSFLKDIVSLSIDGYINCNEDYETSVKGIFACGDVVNKKVRQISTAVNDGTIASLACSNYVK